MKTSPPISLLWFRQDLRLADNPALVAAVARGVVVPVFIWDVAGEGAWSSGAAARWWLHQSLAALETELRALGSRLVVRNGDSLAELEKLLTATGATAVLWNRRYEPAAIARDKRIKETLRARGVAAESSNGALLHEPWTIQNQSGKPFQVFTAYWRNCLAQGEPAAPLLAPKKLPAPPVWPPSLALADLALEPKVDWAAGFRAEWTPGERGAAKSLGEFAPLAPHYEANRNLPATGGTSRFSPHLHFGELSPRQVWHALSGRVPRTSQFLAEIGWREFAHHLLFHFPHTPEKPLRADYEKFPWRTDAAAQAQLRAWQRGRTGYPLVDAGMRQLWATGWMHNRVRMVVGSFLVKHLLVSWREGAAWFWDTLVDADLANNTLGWQWVSGCGADAAPYFRIFNPVTQGEKFDTEGDYVRRWCPELAELPAEWIHQPFAAPTAVLARAGVSLGNNYPHPIVNHGAARVAALAALAEIRQG
ncbi:MAG: Deoxyribodipyrimidine photo-lyase [Verrucomicrobiota bacterium]|jgi:deoxyribodipyrimidine photo-lyase